MHSRFVFSLVVIASLAILAFILLPVFAGAPKSAKTGHYELDEPERPRTQDRSIVRQKRCLSNIKQLGLAMLAYAQDYDERLPISGDVLSPYVLDEAIYTCPSMQYGGGYGLNAARSGHGSYQDGMWEREIIMEAQLDLHFGGSHVCFLDGHGKWIREKDAPTTRLIPLAP